MEEHYTTGRRFLHTLIVSALSTTCRQGIFFVKVQLSYIAISVQGNQVVVLFSRYIVMIIVIMML